MEELGNGAAKPLLRGVHLITPRQAGLGCPSSCKDWFDQSTHFNSQRNAFRHKSAETRGIWSTNIACITKKINKSINHPLLLFGLELFVRKAK